MSFAFGAMAPSTGYDNPAPQNQLFKMRAALDRDGRLNNDEQRVYDDTLTELEFGEGFFRRAHP